MKSSIQTDQTITQQRSGGQQNTNPTIDDQFKLKIEQFAQILERQVKIRFCTPHDYIQYFEENQNIAQIVIPNIFINPFRQKELLLCGIMRFESLSETEFIRRKEGVKIDTELIRKKEGEQTKQNVGTNKADQDEEDDFASQFQKYQQQQQNTYGDKQLFFVTLSISYSQEAQREWDIDHLKKNVLIHIDATQLVSEYSRNSFAKFSSTYSFFDFIQSLFPEDNDLSVQEHYDNIQHLLKKAKGFDKQDNQAQEGSQNNNDDIVLKEEDFGLNVETLQNEGLYPFTGYNIRFQKSVCNHQFKLNKFIYHIGFSRSQKRVILERMNQQLIIVDEQLRLIPRKIKKFRLLDDTIYFEDDNKFTTIATKHIQKQIQFHYQQVELYKKSLLQQNTLSQQKNSIKNEQEEQKPEDMHNQSEKNNDQYQEVFSYDKKKTNEREEKIIQQLQSSNIKLSPKNSVEIDEVELQKRYQQQIDLIDYIVYSEKLFHLYQIISRENTPQYENWQKSIIAQKQIEEKQTQELQENNMSLQDNQRSIARISGLISNFELTNQKDVIERNNNQSPQNLLLNSLQFQDPKQQRKSSFMTGVNAQILTRRLKRAIKSEFKHIRFVTKEERERNYNDGRINHPYAMTYYNSVLRIDTENPNKKRMKEIYKKKREERKIVDAREAFRREEDLKIIDQIYSHKDGFRKKIKVEYLIDYDGELIANISFYDPLSYKLEKVKVKDKKNLEKLQNLLQVKNPLLRDNQLRNILIKMNMKWTRKIIGRKLEFRSFIETNEDFFKYKLNRKKNPNDEALYKLMTTKNYLDEGIRQFTHFLYKVKLALISNDQNAETAEQNYFFNTYFYSTRVQQFQKITNLGRALIQTTVYQSKLLYTTDVYVFIRIDITPATKRTKLIKMILDYNDITTIFSKTKYTLKNCLDHEAITKMIKEFAEIVNYSNTQSYNALKIPYWKQFNQISESSDYDLVNQFDFNSMNTQQEISFLSKKTMLTPVLRTMKIIYQVITVKRYIYLNIDWFQLIIYIPKTSRRFICFLMESDMLKFDPEFMEKVIPLIIVKQESNINELLQSKNYFQFCEEFDQMHKKLILQEVQENLRLNEKKITFRSENWFRKSTNDILSSNNLKIKNQRTSINFTSKLNEYRNSQYRKTANNESLKSIESLNELKESINFSQIRSFNESNSKYASQKINFVKYFQKNLSESTSFLEKKVWEQLISAIVIEENIQSKLVLKINTFSGILRETLSSMVLNMNERDNILYEFYIEEQNCKKKTFESLFKDSKPTKLEESFFQNIFIRVHFFGQDLVHNQKICGRHILFSYHKMNRSKLKNKILEEVKLITKVNANQSIPKISLGQLKKDNLQKMDDTTKIQNILSLLQTGKSGLSKLARAEKKGVSISLNPASSQNENTKQKSIQKKLDEQADNPFLYNFILADMQELAIFYANKIKSNYNQFVKEREKNQLKGRVQDYLNLYKSKTLFKDGECQAILKPNQNFKRHKPIDPQSIKYFSIYRRILTISPRQMMSIFYKPDQSTFYIYCWNNNNSKEVTIKKTLYRIEKYIPHATELLNTKLYKELGDRIFTCYKNKILLKTYKYLKD